MNLKKIVIIETISIVVIFVAIVTFIEIIPSLQPSEENDKIFPYNSVTILENTINLADKEFVKAPFKYSTYDPAIVVLDITFINCDRQGYLTIYCNYRRIIRLFVDPYTLKQSIIMFSFSGSDWVEPPTAMFGFNELLFESDSQNGFSGKISYQITFRGTR